MRQAAQTRRERQRIVNRCYSPGCQATIADPGQDARYCPYCGAVQAYECVACPFRPGALIAVNEEMSCPRCPALYVACAACYHPILVTPDQPLRCPEGCQSGTMDTHTCTYTSAANLGRTRSVTLNPSPFAEQLSETVFAQLGEPVSAPVFRYGRMFVATARGTLRCLSLETGRDVTTWRQCRLFDPDPVTLGDLALHVSQRYVHFLDGPVIKAVSVIDGDPCFEVRTEGDGPQVAIHDDRMLVCSAGHGGVLRVNLYDTCALTRGKVGLLRALELPTGSREPLLSPSPAAFAERSFLMLDLVGNLVQLPVYGHEKPQPAHQNRRMPLPPVVLQSSVDEKKESHILWENQGYRYVSPPVVRGRHVYLVAHDPRRGAAVVALRAGDAAIVNRLPDLATAYIGPAVTSRHLFFFDGERDYHQVILRAVEGPSRPIFYGQVLSLQVAMYEYLALETGDPPGSWLVSLVGIPGRLVPRIVHSETSARPTLDEFGDRALAMGAAGNRLFICDTGTGEVRAYELPRP